MSFLFTGMIFGLIGIGYFIYGKKRQRMALLFAGIALNVVPILVTNIYVLVITGIILIILPYFVKL